jgi:hypothetical protein
MPKLQSHTFASRTSRHTNQSLQKSVPVQTQEEFQNIFSSPSKKIKTPDTQADTTKTLKRSADNGLQGRPRRTPAGNSGFKKLAVRWLNQVQFSNQTFVQVDSFVLRNRQLLKPANR